MNEKNMKFIDRERICVGVITGVHGLKGLVRIKPFTDIPESVSAYGPVEIEDGSRTLEIEVANRTGKGQIAARVLGVNDRNEAETLKGQHLYIKRGQLPSTDLDEFYFADIIGLSVVNNNGDSLGEVLAVHDYGAGAVLECLDKKGVPLMVPFTKEAVPKIDLNNKFILVEEKFFEAFEI
ncbi:MAG: 16S rRNA processing protein RimM [Alphaproteobacteria bacterium]|jgi:16S rRNA processing protein RimM|nr:16S rRNA processing protein RimM [Alphaproteobacteria bacterium]PPR13859.1 MAG: Ribosome maturation factor RimM [Alphaproteobacteria bacterium MarineAlpha12_Bin1]|tara:strand:- start:1177 stop:1716 length:540 start_codon:yes stop_codon:yes gene_type:complete